MQDFNYGRSTCPEFGLTLTTESEAKEQQNPWNTEHIAGGYGGLASCFWCCALAHSNDGGGSTRIPASCCGNGLKVSRGRISLGPIANDISSPIIAEVIAKQLEIQQHFWMPFLNQL